MDIEVIIERHEQRLNTLERDMSAMKEVQNETLVTLTNELKHINEHLKRHEQKIDEIESFPIPFSSGEYFVRFVMSYRFSPFQSKVNKALFVYISYHCERGLYSEPDARDD